MHEHFGDQKDGRIIFQIRIYKGSMDVEIRKCKSFQLTTKSKQKYNQKRQVLLLPVPIKLLQYN